VSLFGVEQGIHCIIGTAAGLASYRGSGQLSVHDLFSMTCRLGRGDVERAFEKFEPIGNVTYE
jgi:hypothetical protein